MPLYQTDIVEVKVGFEPTILRICNPLPWTTRPLHHDLIIQNNIRSRPNHAHWNNPGRVDKSVFLIR